MKILLFSNSDLELGLTKDKVSRVLHLQWTKWTCDIQNWSYWGEMLFIETVTLNSLTTKLAFPSNRSTNWQNVRNKQHTWLKILSVNQKAIWSNSDLDLSITNIKLWQTTWQHNRYSKVGVYKKNQLHFWCQLSRSDTLKL